MNDFNPYYLRLIRRYHQAGLVLDTCVLLLLLAGCIDRDYIKTFKPTKDFSEEDFDLLQKFVNCFNRLVVTPHILAEVTSSTNRLKDKRKLHTYLDTFRQYGLGSKESYYNIKKIVDIADIKYIPHFGVTDTSLLAIAKARKYLVVTEDGPLAELIGNREQLDVVNFNHFRTSKPTNFLTL